MIDDLARGIQQHDARGGAFERIVTHGQASDALRISKNALAAEMTRKQVAG